MKGLVIGRDGLIGGAFQRSRPPGEMTLGTSRKAAADDAQQLFLDLSQPPSDLSFLDSGFDWALFAAAVPDINRCDADPVGSRRINVENTITVLNALRERGIFTVFLSTNMVFDGSQAKTPEDSPVSPVTEYGRQKVQVESWIRESFPNAAIVRLSKVLGGPKTIFSAWLEQLRKGEPARAFTDLSIAPVTLETVCECLDAIVTNHESGIYQISGDEELKYSWLCQELARRVGADLSLVHTIPAREAGYRLRLPLPKFTSLSVQKIEKLTRKKIPSSREALKLFFDQLQRRN